MFQAELIEKAARFRSAEHDLSTRMYRSLGELVAGWSKNIVMGGLQSFPRWTRPFVAPISFVSGAVLWLLAPGVLVLGGLQAAAGIPARYSRADGSPVQSSRPCRTRTISTTPSLRTV